MPEKADGRLREYKHDEDGRCSASASKAMNPALDRFVPHSH